jgi:exoribonuclease-2
MLHAIWSEESPIKRLDLNDSHISFWTEAIKDFCIKGADSAHYLLVKNLFKNAGLNPSSAPFETLVKGGIWGEDENLELLRYELVTDFSKDLSDEGERIAARRLNRKNRIDLTSLDVFTIDGPETLDLDDAISFRKTGDDFEIGIHITDIGLKLEPESSLFKEAIERATSIYLPDKKISMLPESLSQNAWSLIEGKNRETLSFFAILDANAVIKHSRIIPSLIKVKKRLTYQEVYSDISKKGEFYILHDLCNQIQNQRIKNGALPLPIPELVIIIDENGNINPRLSCLDPARFMVAECMILANSIAANFLKENRIPALFRSQPAPRERIITGIEFDIKVNYQQRRLISKGDLGSKPEWHSGLGLGAYTTITSPLRRGLDLMMQQQITSFIHGKKAILTRERLSRLKILLQEGLSKAAAVRQARVRYWMLKFFQKLIDVPMNAWILDSNQKIIAVLSDYLIPVELPKRQGMNFFMGQDIKICIKKSMPRENILKVEWA